MKKSQPNSNRKFSKYFYNSITYFGIGLSLFVFFIECLLFGMDFFGPTHSIYLGIFTYTVLPPFLILGLILIPVGALWKRRQVIRGKVEIDPKPIHIDLSIAHHRNAVMTAIAIFGIFIVMSAVGSYQAFHYTESVHFCGITCHEVMSPQYTRYTQSAHARVKCVDCHIGSGADWYVRSKLSGMRQVLAVFRNSYSRPIPNPVHNLRPAKETCEQCHWPDKFYSSFELKRKYFLADPDDDYSSWMIRMLIQMGSTNDKTVGIHAHMNINNDILYYAEDERRQEIPWIKTVDHDGKETIYTSEDSAYKDKEPPAEGIRKMDCIDCHNRPTHRFIAPYRLVNQSMDVNLIDPELPSIKSKAMEVLSVEYVSKEEAAVKIRQTLEAFYKRKLGAGYEEKKESVLKTIDEIISIYKDNFFPSMKARWDSYPDNIGHLISPGCFRCHDGTHSTPEGKVISRDCTSCHTILEQGPPGSEQKSTEGLEFRHPVDISEMWKEMNCYDCHTGN